jgi:hypothetical protein
MSPRNRVAQLYPRALGSLYVVSYDSQGYGGDILTLPLPGRTGIGIEIGWFSPTSGGVHKGEILGVTIARVA